MEVEKGWNGMGNIGTCKCNDKHETRFLFSWTKFTIPIWWMTTQRGKKDTHMLSVDTTGDLAISIFLVGDLALPKIPRARPTVERLGRPPADVRDAAFSSLADGRPRPPPPRLLVFFLSSSLETDSSSSSFLPSSSSASSSSSSAGSSSPSGANRNSQIRSPSSSLVPKGIDKKGL